MIETAEQVVEGFKKNGGLATKAFVGDDPAIANLDPNVHSQMVILDHRVGDVKLMWDRTKPDEVAAARATFDSLKKKGYYAYKVTEKDATKGDIVTEFDPNIERLIMAPKMAGG